MSEGELGQRWQQLIDGTTCPFCHPRPDSNEYWLLVQQLSAGTLYLDRNQTYRGKSLLIFDRRHVTGLEKLSTDEFLEFTSDLRVAAHAVASFCAPDLMNYASLGNVIPHLHWHIIPRYGNDPRWGKPIYTTSEGEVPETLLRAQEYEQLTDSLRNALP
jgi:ATP adenylyltransferase